MRIPVFVSCPTTLNAKQNAARSRIVEAGNQVHQRCFSRPTPGNNGYIPYLGNFKNLHSSPPLLPYPLILVRKYHCLRFLSTH